MRFVCVFLSIAASFSHLHAKLMLLSLFQHNHHRCRCRRRHQSTVSMLSYIPMPEYMLYGLKPTPRVFFLNIRIQSKMRNYKLQI